MHVSEVAMEVGLGSDIDEFGFQILQSVSSFLRLRALDVMHCV